LNGIKILYEGCEAEIIEKKSRFIATVIPISEETDAVKFIEEMRKKYWNASHNCFAYVIGEKHEIQRCSDDGEPSGTAGKPMLDVLLGEDIHNVCVVVTRYFGGTLLGTGGLVRAYSRAAKEGVKSSVILEKMKGFRGIIDIDYNIVGQIQYILAKLAIVTLNSEYSNRVLLEILIPEHLKENVNRQIMELTAGKVEIQIVEMLSYGIKNKELIVLN
jgi:uncharacterized protein, YigZ family